MEFYFDKKFPLFLMENLWFQFLFLIHTVNVKEKPAENKPML